MADQTILDVSDRGSPQYLAWLLLESVASSEDKGVGDWVSADREWIYKTYEQCLRRANSASAEQVLRGR